MFKRTLNNLSERALVGELITSIFVVPLRMNTMDWARQYRNITSSETSFGIGSFEPNHTPVMEYVYDCLDNPRIPVITAQKSARVAWTETINNYRGARIHLRPTNMLLGFATGAAAKVFAKGKWKDFLSNTRVLKSIINLNVPKNKEGIYDYFFRGGSLRLATLGSITSVKSDNIPYIEIEEPDDAKDDVAGQGDLLKNLEQRQKTVPKTQRKIIFGGTPTHKDFSRVEKALKNSNQLVFKAECHECKELISMGGDSFANIHYDEYPNRYIDDIYGIYDPTTAYFLCPCCKTEWTFEQKNLNIIAGKQHGFYDHTGNFSKGWHSSNPKIVDNFGFYFSELLSPFDGSTFVELAKDIITANLERAKGNEAPMKSLYNNRMGLPYAAGHSSLDVEEMKKYRSNYKEGIVPMEGLLLTVGIDVQHNRFAYVVLAWGRNGNVYLVRWAEIFGNVFNWEDKVWKELSDVCTKLYPHAGGKELQVEAVSIDSGDGSTTELVYRWVLQMSQQFGALTEYNIHFRATKGVKELRYSSDEIYKEPSVPLVNVNPKFERQSLAETMGVTVFQIGAHRCHDEILRRISQNKQRDEEGNILVKYDVFYFCDTEYGNFEEQMTSCRKLIENSSSVVREKYELIAGKRKEAIDCCKNAFHASYAERIREFTNSAWESREKFLLPC